MMLRRCLGIALLGSALGGCITSGNSTYVLAPGTPIAWDGAGREPGDAPPATRRSRRPTTDVIIGPLNGMEVRAESSGGTTGSSADPPLSDADLRKRMVICGNCLAPAAAQAD